MRQMKRTPDRPMTRIEVELAAERVGIPRRAIWRVRTEVVLTMIALRIKNA